MTVKRRILEASYWMALIGYCAVIMGLPLIIGVMVTTAVGADTPQWPVYWEIGAGVWSGIWTIINGAAR